MSWISEYIQDKQFEYPNMFKSPIEPLRYLFLSTAPNILKDNGKLFVMTENNRKIHIEDYYKCEKPLDETLMDYLLNNDIETEKIYNSKKDEYLKSLGDIDDSELEDALNKLYNTIQVSLNHAINNLDNIKQYDENLLTDIDFVYNKINEQEFEPYLRLYKMESLLTSIHEMFTEHTNIFVTRVFLTLCRAYIKIMEEFINGRPIVKKTCITCDTDEILDCYRADVHILYHIVVYIETLTHK